MEGVSSKETGLGFKGVDSKADNSIPRIAFFSGSLIYN
jgi:hypothetical protein